MKKLKNLIEFDIIEPKYIDGTIYGFKEDGYEIRIRNDGKRKMKSFFVPISYLEKHSLEKLGKIVNCVIKSIKEM